MEKTAVLPRTSFDRPFVREAHYATRRAPATLVAERKLLDLFRLEDHRFCLLWRCLQAAVFLDFAGGLPTSSLWTSGVLALLSSFSWPLKKATFLTLTWQALDLAGPFLDFVFGTFLVAWRNRGTDQSPHGMDRLVAGGATRKKWHGMSHQHLCTRDAMLLLASSADFKDLHASWLCHGTVASSTPRMEP